VREVDPKDIGAGENELLDDGGIVGGRAESGDDLGATPLVVGASVGNQRSTAN
jgi:hypothetical protein